MWLSSWLRIPVPSRLFTSNVSFYTFGDQQIIVHGCRTNKFLYLPWPRIDIYIRPIAQTPGAMQRDDSTCAGSQCNLSCQSCCPPFPQNPEHLLDFDAFPRMFGLLAASKDKLSLWIGRIWQPVTSAYWKTPDCGHHPFMWESNRLNPGHEDLSHEFLICPNRRFSCK